MTVNKALSTLTAAGLIVRRRRSGSFVASPKSQETVIEIHDIKFEVQSAGRRYRHEILVNERRPATLDERVRLEADREGQVLVLVVRHFAVERPFVLDDSSEEGRVGEECVSTGG